MWLFRKPLAALPPSDDVLSIVHGCWPVESTSQSFGDEGAAGCVVIADAFVDVLEDSFAITDDDASLEHTQNDALVQLAIVKSECFGPARYVLGICQVVGQ